MGPSPMSAQPARLRVFGFGCVLVAIFLATLWAVWPEQQTPRAESAPAAPWQPSPADPVRLEVPRIKLSSKIVPIEMGEDQVLHPPEDTTQTGWWRSSARPGSKQGQTLLTGHSVHSGGGVMNRLGELKTGDRVRVRTRENLTTYKIIQISTWSREQIAATADELFGQNINHRRLVLVTCTDWVDGEYTRNIVAFAAPIRSVPLLKRTTPQPKVSGTTKAKQPA